MSDGDLFHLDVGKARNARRRRLEIRNLKSSCRSEDTVNSARKGRSGDNKNDLMLTSSSSLSSSSPGYSSEESIKSSGEEKEVACVSHGFASIMGRRRGMEDAVRIKIGFSVVDSRKFDFFGVYDGHGGARVAEACGERMHRILENEMDGEASKMAEEGGGVNWEKLMARCFKKMDREVGGGDGSEEDVEEMTVGSTAVMAVVGKEEVVVANCGDSRAVICRGGVAVPLSVDHKPDRPDELARIEAAGGRVINWNGPRVLGVLATSRSIGDHYLKPYVISNPEVSICSRTKDDEFLILATDGLWDVVSNELACQVVRRSLDGKIPRASLNGGVGSSLASAAAALLAELALARGSSDNISVVVVELRKSRKSICS
ncbi:hypothetical protein Nepgr_029936 [Nepenthes gracilis]|uniref:protein-serine/threonine phosphatase n=1 Tax=Nepenthes gracilis TaxID=150966 RepID=A0AAD3Y3P6_NEPGR|nr:hypothetical protein Nepgr_029936 [Nepenthes gracilis]